jgi:hypothetical protein
VLRFEGMLEILPSKIRRSAGRRTHPNGRFLADTNHPMRSQEWFKQMAEIGASPSLPDIWGTSLHRTHSGRSPWQRERSRFRTTII